MQHVVVDLIINLMNEELKELGKQLHQNYNNMKNKSE